MIRRTPIYTLFPYTTLFRSRLRDEARGAGKQDERPCVGQPDAGAEFLAAARRRLHEPLVERLGARSEEHTSELQSQSNLVCRLLLEKKKTLWSLWLSWSCTK